MADSKRTTAPSVWSLVSSIGLVYCVPQLMLLLLGMMTGGFGVGWPELNLLMSVYFVAIPWVVVRWLARRKNATGATSA